MGLKIPRYQSKSWRAVQDPATSAALADLAQKLELLARDVAPGIVWPDGVVPSFAPCPPGWECVTELEGRVMLGTVPENNDVQAIGGSMTHDHTMNHGHTASSAAVADHTHAITAAPTHTHSISTDGDHSHSMNVDSPDIQNSADNSENVTVDAQTSTDGAHSHGGATGAGGAHDHGAATGSSGSHSHAITVNSHAGDTGTTDSTPAYVKVYFCRRIRSEER